jgi:hypothetical protein
LPIFPINAVTGVPRIRWGQGASKDINAARWWIYRWPNSFWGIAVPPNLIVVDIDVKDGKRGFASFKHLSGCHPDDLKTWQASTPSGGRHMWLTPITIRTSATA